jgi:hypothetical protein
MWHKLLIALAGLGERQTRSTIRRHHSHISAGSPSSASPPGAISTPAESLYLPAYLGPGDLPRDAQLTSSPPSTRLGEADRPTPPQGCHLIPPTARERPTGLNSTEAAPELG